VYSAYPVSVSSTSNQQIRLDDSYHAPQQYQSVAGFNKTVTQHQYQTPQPSTPQTRATVRAVTNQERYNVQQSPHATLVSPQHHNFQFDNRQQPGHPTGTPVVYQTPGAAQFTHHNVDLWTEGPSQGQDQYAQAQRVSVRSVSTGSPQQSHSISPQRHQDHLQQYYSQLTPEQHQQLLRQQQIQRQQEQKSHHEQQHRVTAQHISPSTSHQQEPYRSTVNVDGGQHNQTRHIRSESERQNQDEQDYYAAQRQLAAQRIQQLQPQPEQDQSSHPVGIRNLMNKFAGPTPVQPSSPRSKPTSTRYYSSSSHTSTSGPRQTTTTRSLTSHSMTYSALPKPAEPPVNSVEYYEMLMQNQGANAIANIQQAIAPAHIQHTPTGFDALRGRFKTGSFSEDMNPPQIMQRQVQQKQQQQQPKNTPKGTSLSSLRNQYMNQAKQSINDELHAQHLQHISRTIVGEDIPQQKGQQQAFVQQPPPQSQVYTQPMRPQLQQQSAPQVPLQQQPAPQAPLQQPAPQNPPPQQQQQPEPQPAPQTPPQEEQQSTPEAPPQQQPAAAKQASKQQATPKKEQSQKKNETVDQKESSSEVTSPPTTADTATA
jgi:hypothetical protein